MPVANTEQIAFRGRVDDGSETAATWKAAQNANWTQAVDVNFRVRFEIEEDAGVASVLDGQLQYNLAAAGWNAVNGSSSVVKAVASAQVADGAATTDQMTGSALAFVAGSIDEVDGATAAVTLTSQSTQLEFVVTIVSGDVTDGQTLQLRVTDAGVALNVYTATPTITVSELAIDLSASLQAFWKLEEASGTREDCFGAHDLTDNNTVTQAVGKIGNAAQFTRANSEHLSEVDTPGLSLGSTSDLSLCIWIYLDSLNDFQSFVGKGDGATIAASEYEILYRSSTGRIAFEVADGVGWTVALANAIGTPSLATWYFIVAWYDNAGDTVNIQVNDGVIDSAAAAITAQDTASIFSIGSTGGAAGMFHDGRIDGVGVWKKVLNVNERSDLYNLGAGKEVCAAAATTGVGWYGPAGWF